MFIGVWQFFLLGPAAGFCGSMMTVLMRDRRFNIRAAACTSCALTACKRRWISCSSVYWKPRASRRSHHGGLGRHGVFGVDFADRCLGFDALQFFGNAVVGNVFDFLAQLGNHGIGFTPSAGMAITLNSGISRLMMS